MSLNPLDLLFGQVRREIEQHSAPDTPGPSYDAGGLLNILGGIFGQHAQQQGTQFDPDRGYQEASTNYNPQWGNVQSSDADPLGDPGLQGGQSGNFGNVASSDEDPLGDPGLQR